MSKLDELMKLKKDLDKKIAVLGKDALRELFDQFFSANPGIKSFKWDQYSPHFNDGDACVFSLRPLYVKFKPDSLKELDLNEEDAEGDEGYFCEYDLNGTSIRKAINELEDNLNEVDNILEAVFGDGYTVTVYRNKIETEECDHD